MQGNIVWRNPAMRSFVSEGCDTVHVARVVIYMKFTGNYNFEIWVYDTKTIFPFFVWMFELYERLENW